MKLNTKANKLALLSLTAVIMACGANARADDKELLDRIKKLEDRIAELEGKGPAVAAEKGQPWESFIGATKLSGYVSGSYMYNWNRAEPVTGRLFDNNHNEFSLNKFKLTLEKGVPYSSTNWDVGYRTDVIFGQDAQKNQAAGLSLGNQGDLEQAYLTVNAPVGNGLQFSVGKMVTLLGLEVIEETANPNWSVGNQFMFAENATSLGGQVAYKFNDKIDAQARVMNGWDVVKDNNNSLSYMGRIGFTLTEKFNFAVLGYGGPEETDNSGAWRKGAELLLNYKFTPKLQMWLQGDYGREDASEQLAALTGNASLLNDDADWYAVGGWLQYDFTDKVGVALRADYFADKDGARTSGSPVFAPYPANDGQDLTSLTATLNYRPIKNLQIRPEVRWDHSDLTGGAYRYDSTSNRKNQVTSMLGVAYLF